MKEDWLDDEIFDKDRIMSEMREEDSKRKENSRKGSPSKVKNKSPSLFRKKLEEQV